MTSSSINARYDLTIAEGGCSSGYDRVTLAAPQELDIWQRNLEADYQKTPGTEHSLYHLSISEGEDPSASRPFFVEVPLAAAPTASAAKRLGFWADHTNSGPSRPSWKQLLPRIEALAACGFRETWAGRRRLRSSSIPEMFEAKSIWRSFAT